MLNSAKVFPGWRSELHTLLLTILKIHQTYSFSCFDVKYFFLQIDPMSPQCVVFPKNTVQWQLDLFLLLVDV